VLPCVAQGSGLEGGHRISLNLAPLSSGKILWTDLFPTLLVIRRFVMISHVEEAHEYDEWVNFTVSLSILIH
jgi:hypothetical protein